MAIALHIKTSERARVVSPWDPALDDATKARLLADDLDALQGASLPGATWFEVRGLSAGEVRRLRPLLPPPPEDVRAWFADHNVVGPALWRNLDAWYAEVGFVYLRVALDAPTLDGWPTARESFLGLQLWPESAIDALPHDTGRWLGLLAYRLSTFAPEKKSLSGSPLGGPSGTTAGEEKTTSGVSG